MEAANRGWLDSTRGKVRFFCVQSVHTKRENLNRDRIEFFVVPIMSHLVIEVLPLTNIICSTSLTA